MSTWGAIINAGFQDWGNFALWIAIVVVALGAAGDVRR